MNRSIIKLIKKLLYNKPLKNFLSLAGSALACAVTAASLKDQINGIRQIRENEVYSTEQAARLIKIEEQEIHKLLDTGSIPCKTIGGKTRILGKHIIGYLS